jgi:tryptophanyl-tRNA synthetase
MGLDGENKMSKSLGNTIGILEEPEKIWAKLGPAKTDERRKRRSDPGVPEDCNVYMSYHRSFSSEDDLARIRRGCTGAEIGCLECKKILMANMEKVLGPIRAKAGDLLARPEEVHAALDRGAARAREVAGDVVREARSAMGLRRR